jgi:hypothetical protein
MRAIDRPNSDYILPCNRDYYAWICLDKEELEQLVPEQFPMRNDRMWKDYCSLVNTPDGLTFIKVGYIEDDHGNRKARISKEEFQLYRDHFKGRNIWTFNEAMEYMKQFELGENNDSLDG